MADLTVFYTLGIALVIVGIIVIVVAVASIITGDAKKSVRSAGVIMIGPIPIIFGSDKKLTKTVLVLALALTIVVITFFLMHYWFWR